MASKVSVTSRMKVLVIDDETGRNERWRDRVASVVQPGDGYEVSFEDNSTIRVALDGLHQRREAARREDKVGKMDDNLFDTVDILFVDYDLFDLDSKTDFTGEIVSYLARCFSRCGIIVAVNQYGAGLRTFDLRLSGHPESFADVHISLDDLDNPGLWSEPWKNFRPWYWPLLPRAVSTLEERTSDVAENLDRRVLEHLGLSEHFPQSARVLSFLGSRKRPHEVTFYDFVKDSGAALRPKDKPASREAAARIASARIAKWLESTVLSGQDVLIDAPHLVSRFPSLVGDSELESWNQYATLSVRPSKSLFERLDSFRLKKETWLARPVWLWTALRDHTGIQEVQDPWSADPSPFAFCEDISLFVPRSEATEFVADVESPFAQRYIFRVPNVSYVPEFLLET